MYTSGAWAIPIPLQVDSYQATHFLQIPTGMENFQLSQATYRHPLPFNGDTADRRVLSAGVAPFVSQYLAAPITDEDVRETADFMGTFWSGNPHPWPKDMFERIVGQYGGQYPIVVDALFDGQTHFVGEPHIQIWTDEPGMGECVGWIESTLGPYSWVSSIVATRGRMRQERLMAIYRDCYPSASEEDIRTWVSYRIHDFGRRGAANSLLSGIAHLYNYLGTDTIDAAYVATKYLNDGRTFGAGSIPAAAHRTVTPWPLEDQAIDRMFEMFSGGMFAFVADTYDYKRCIERLGSRAAALQVKGGWLVGRTDSGNHIANILYCLRVFSECFGSKRQEKGLIEINGASCIDGDGVSDELMFETIFPAIIGAGFSPINLAIGMGGHNHKALRGETEWGFKTALVGDGHGGFHESMKRAEDAFKRSIPGAVLVDVSGASTGSYANRVQPIAVEELQAGRIGDLHRLYDGRPGKNRHPERELFTGTRDRAFASWKAHPRHPGMDTFDPRIRRMQDDYMRRMTGPI